MAKQLTELKTQLQRRIRDKTDGTIESADQTDFFNRAIDKLKSFHEFPGTKQRQEIHIFDGVDEYAVPTGFKTPIDFITEGGYDDWERTTSKTFYKERITENNIYAIDNYNETEILLVSRNVSKGNVSLNNCDSLTENGTWAADILTDATNLTEDTTEFKEGTGSLNFDITALTTDAAIENSTMTALNLADHEDKSSIFCWVFIPDPTNIASFDLRWGTSVADYWTNSATTAHSGQSFKQGWNRLSFEWDGSTQVGAPSASGVNYMRLNMVYDLLQEIDTDFRVDDFRSLMPERLTMNYYSSNFVKSDLGTYQVDFLLDDDTSILENFEDEVLLYLALEEAFEVLREPDDAARARVKANEIFGRISNDKPSEETKATDTYYHMPSTPRRINHY